MIKEIYQIIKSGEYKAHVEEKKKYESTFEAHNQGEYQKLMTKEGILYKPHPWSRLAIAVFANKGLWCLAEVDQGGHGSLFAGMNKEVLAFVPYNRVIALSYTVSECGKYLDQKNRYSSVWLQYEYIEEGFGEPQRNTLVLRVSRTTGAARRFAHKISNRCGGIKVKRNSLF